MYCSWLVFRPGLLGLETSGGGGFTGPGAAGIPVGATAVVVDILWQLDHLLSQQQLREALVMEAWHPISGPSQAPAEASRDAITWKASTSARTQLSLSPQWIYGCGTPQSHPSLCSSTWEKWKHESLAPRKGVGKSMKGLVPFSSQPNGLVRAGSILPVCQLLGCGEVLNN